MKYLLLLFALTLAISSFGQKPPRGVKSIILTVDSTGGDKVLLNNISKYLLSKGFEIDLINYDLGLVQTKDTRLKFAHWKYRVSAIVSANKLTLTGKNIVHVSSGDVARDIENKGALGDIWIYSFAAMNKLAIEYPHIGIEYK